MAEYSALETPAKRPADSMASSPWADAVREMYKPPEIDKSLLAASSMINPASLAQEKTTSTKEASAHRTDSGSQDFIDPVLTAIRKEIRLHERQNARESYLGNLVGRVYSKDKRTLADLQRSYAEAKEKRDAGRWDELAKVEAKAIQTIQKDAKSTATKSEIEYYGRALTKTAFLFLNGASGLIGTTAASALDEMKPADSAGLQTIDGVLGTAKGIIMKTGADAITGQDMSIAAKGMSLGVLNRALDLGLSRQTYIDPGTGQVNFRNGLSTAFLSTVDPEALATDVISFKTATALNGTINGITNNAILRHPFAATVATGATFGMSSGLTEELSREHQNGEPLDPAKLAYRALMQAALGGIAGIPGGIQAEYNLRQITAKQQQELRQLQDKLRQQLAKELERAKAQADHQAGQKKLTSNAATEQAAKSKERLPDEQRIARVKKESQVKGIDFQNEDVQELAKNSYDAQSLERVRKALAEHKTLRLRRYSSGGSSAVTITDQRSLESAVSGELDNQWDRDNAMQVLAEETLLADPALAKGLKLSANQAKEGLLSSLKHHFQYQDRMIDIIENRASGLDYDKRPQIRYNPVTLGEVSEPWGHAQNDALGFIDYSLFRQLNSGELSWEDPVVQPLAKAYATLLPQYFKSIHYWEDWDFGAWEEGPRAERASSIGVAVAGLREQLKFVQKHGPMTYEAHGKTYTTSEADLQHLIGLGEQKLKQILPNEYIRADKGATRQVDAALINPLFLSALSGRPLVDDATTLKVIDNIEKELMGPIGINRYQNDHWDGRVNRPQVERHGEAQWSHVSPMISVIFGEMYQRTGNPAYLERQIYHFNRGLAAVDQRWHTPEAYITDPRTQKWVPDANEPLAWSQSALVMALSAMKKSLQEPNHGAAVTSSKR